MKPLVCVDNMGRALCASILVFASSGSLTSASADGVIDQNIKTIEQRLDNHQGKLDFDTRLATVNLVRERDKCIDAVLAFTKGAGNESSRRTIGIDILFGIETDASRSALLQLFSSYYVVLTDNLPSFQRLNGNTVVFESAAPAEYNKFMFAYYVAKEAVLRDSRLAREVVTLISERDIMSRGLLTASKLLNKPPGCRVEKLVLETDANYIISLVPFLPQMKKEIEQNAVLLEEFRRWYLSVLGSELLNMTGYACFVNAIEQADAGYLYEPAVFKQLAFAQEQTGKHDRADLLKTRKARYELRCSGGKP